MIFVTVGAQMPFDRMTRAVDAWCGERGRQDVFMQTGETSWTPSHARFERMVGPKRFRELIAECRVVVAHAGMGSILSALQASKPILVVPRRAQNRETRNDHQVGTARRFLALGKIGVAMDEVELASALDRLDELVAGAAISPWASPQLLGAIAGFLRDGVRHAD